MKLGGFAERRVSQPPAGASLLLLGELAMKRIWKFPCNICDQLTIDMPLGAKVLCVQMQHDEPCIWALVDDNMPLTPYPFAWRGTGHHCDGIDAAKYIGTIQMQGGELIFHLFRG